MSPPVIKRPVLEREEQPQAYQYNQDQGQPQMLYRMRQEDIMRHLAEADVYGLGGGIDGGFQQQDMPDVQFDGGSQQQESEPMQAQRPMQAQQRQQQPMQPAIPRQPMQHQGGMS